jgi:phage terminase small subunit
MEQCITPVVEKTFAENYLKLRNGAKAVRASNIETKYPSKLARELLAKESVKVYLKEAFDKIKDELILDRNEVLKLTSDIAQGLIKEERQFVVGFKLVTKKCEASLRDRLKALELLAKMYKMFDTDLNQKPTIILSPNMDVPSLPTLKEAKNEE